MSNVFVLLHKPDSDTTKIIGVVTKVRIADKFIESNWNEHYIEECELDDPELLNRIAKENSKDE